MLGRVSILCDHRAAVLESHGCRLSEGSLGPHKFSSNLGRIEEFRVMSIFVADCSS